MSLSATRNATSKKFLVADAIDSDAIDEIADAELDRYEFQKYLSSDERAEKLMVRRMRRWMENREDVMRKISLIEDCDGETMTYARSLTSIGVTTPSEGNLFVDFYLKVYDPSRSWVSGCQVDQSRAASIALTANYNKLPDWVCKGLMNAPHSARIGGDRIGNIWRLIPCVKAWRWCTDLPKKWAEKIGKCSPRLRMLASWAYPQHGISHKYIDGGWVSVSVDFWELLSKLDRMSNPEILNWMLEQEQGQTPRWGHVKWSAFLAEISGYSFEQVKSQLPKRIDSSSVMEWILTYGDPRTACQMMFGTSGPATVKAYLVSSQNRVEWARAIGEGSPDAVQKILSLNSCVDFQQETLRFLLSLPMSARIRMIAKTTFVYRGETCLLSSDHIRDTGYLWEQLYFASIGGGDQSIVMPDLGRVRCWFSIHEILAAEFVKNLRDEPLPIAELWKPIDGLCAIDGSWTIELPSRVATLKYYGEALRNCVGGYGPAIKQGRSVIFAVREKGILTHCVEVCDRTVRQFYSSGHRSADQEIKSSVLDVLWSAGLVN